MTFTRAAQLAELDNAHPLAVEVDGVDVVLVLQGDEVYALRDECSHAAVRLSEGDVEGETIECSLHGAAFDLRSGAALTLPATSPVATYPVQISGDEVLVDVSSEEN